MGRRIERLGPEIKAALKAYWAPGLFFEELDLAYMGVIDGHDVGALRGALTEAFEAERPVVVHIHTVKGKGFAPAEANGLAVDGGVARGEAELDRQRPPDIEGAAPEDQSRSRKPTRRRGSSGSRSRPRRARRRSTRKVFADALVAEAERD